jgi:hypothetical protein
MRWDGVARVSLLSSVDNNEADPKPTSLTGTKSVPQAAAVPTSML